MAGSKPRPLKLADDNEAIPIPQEFDPSDDFVNCKGVVAEDNIANCLQIDVDGDWTYEDANSTQTKFASVAAQAQAARYTITLQSQGTIGNGYFYGYSNNIPGDTTPVIIPEDSTFLEFTFANSQSNADYTLSFRKNGTGAIPFYTVSQVNTQFFADNNPSESFVQGDEIYVQHTVDGNNARDVAIVLLFQVNP
jgi:hypothetical protein